LPDYSLNCTPLSPITTTTPAAAAATATAMVAYKSGRKESFDNEARGREADPVLSRCTRIAPGKIALSDNFLLY